MRYILSATADGSCEARAADQHDSSVIENITPIPEIDAAQLQAATITVPRNPFT
nr:hypothetical protein [Flagellatimonas centrodinii]